MSTGGFTKEAHDQADRTNVPLALVDMPQLCMLLLEHYEQIDPGTRRTGAWMGVLGRDRDVG